MSTDEPIHHKYNVARVDKAELDPDSKHFGGCQVFVLDIDHDPAARVALRAYAKAVEVTHPVLADELRAVIAEQETP